MKRIALAVAALACVSIPAFADCAKDYRDFWDRMGASAPAKKMTGAQYAALSRTALRGYDACTSGDERFNTKNFFKKLDASAPLKADELFQELSRSAPAKK